jgi:hypothetical protein
MLPRNLRAAITIAGLASGCLLTGVNPATAHHSFALFDMQTTLTLEGTVKAFEWTNPHSWIRLVVVGKNNQTEDWLIELPAAAVLAREGWNKFYLKPGERISVNINPVKGGMKAGLLKSFREEAE